MRSGARRPAMAQGARVRVPRRSSSSAPSGARRSTWSGPRTGGAPCAWPRRPPRLPRTRARDAGGVGRPAAAGCPSAAEAAPGVPGSTGIDVPWRQTTWRCRAPRAAPGRWGGGQGGLRGVVGVGGRSGPASVRARAERGERRPARVPAAVSADSCARCPVARDGGAPPAGPPPKTRRALRSGPRPGWLPLRRSISFSHAFHLTVKPDFSFRHTGGLSCWRCACRSRSSPSWWPS